MYEISPFLHPVHTYPLENKKGWAYAIDPEFDLKIFLCTTYALNDLE